MVSFEAQQLRTSQVKTESKLNPDDFQQVSIGRYVEEPQINWEELLVTERTRVNGLIAAFVQAQTNMENQYQQVLTQIPGKILEVAMYLAENIIEQQVKLDSKIILGMIEKLITECSLKSDLKIIINQEDYQFLSSEQSEQLNQWKNQGVVLEPNTSQPRFVFRVFLGTHFVEVSIPKRLELLWQEIKPLFIQLENGEANI